MTDKCSAVCGEEFSAHDMEISRENRARIKNAIAHLPDYVKRYAPELPWKKTSSGSMTPGTSG